MKLYKLWQWSNPKLLFSIHHLQQILPALEERRPLRLDLNAVTGLWIASLIAAILAHLEGAEAAYLYATTIHKLLLHHVDHGLDDAAGEGRGDAAFLCQCLEEAA